MSVFRRLALVLGCLGSLCAAASSSDAPQALHIPKFEPSPGKGTRCGACHSVKGWMQVVFPHEKTGFPLKGRHSTVTCRACHQVDFVKTLPQSCSGCHPDVHTGALGGRCENCHQETDWAPLFDAQAHRFTNFPLTGRHALLPCESCHPNARTREFARQTVDCQACHLADYLNATTLFGINHAQLFGADATNCRTCHDWRSFKGARFAGHDTCFIISSNWHAGISCSDCHSRIPTAQDATCKVDQPSLTCTGCHTHNKPVTDAIHAPLLGGLVYASQYRYDSSGCYGCHPQHF